MSGEPIDGVDGTVAVSADGLEVPQLSECGLAPHAHARLVRLDEVAELADAVDEHGAPVPVGAQVLEVGLGAQPREQGKW